MTTEKKLTPSEKRAMKRKEQIAKGEALAGTAKGSFEPTVAKETYSIDLLKALNYYNVAYDDKDKRKWVLTHVGKNAAKAYDNVPDHEYRQLGAVVRLLHRDQYVGEKEVAFIDAKLAELRKNYPLVTAATEAKPVKTGPSIQDRMLASAGVHAAEFDGMLDEFVLNDVVPDFNAYLKNNQVSPQVSKLIPTFFTRQAAELVEVLEKKCEQLVEGYSNFKPAKLKKFMAIIVALEAACTQRVAAAKAERKPRARKEKPASVIAKGVKYMKEFAELGLKSELPPKIVGASTVVIYNTKYKKVMVYEADDTGKLTVKGTRILGYSIAKSGAKTLRKPELAKDIAGMNKTEIRKTFKSLTTKESAVNGRINEECIILKVL